jgi:hypothetical protein
MLQSIMQRNTIVNERTSQEGAHLVVAVAPASTSAQVDGGEKGVLDVDGAADAAVLRVGGGCSKATDVMWGGGAVAAAEMVSSWLRWN